MNNRRRELLKIVPATGKLFAALLLYLCITGFWQVTSASDESGLLILNSDNSVLKYALTEKIFLKNQKQFITTINLSNTDFIQSELVEILNRGDFKTIYCIGTKAYLLALKLAPESNLIFSSVINWRRLPLTEKSYGISQELSTDMQLTMYRYLFPKLKAIGVLYSQEFNKEWLLNAKQSAEDVGLKLIARDITEEKNLSITINQLLKQVDALWLIADPVVLNNKNSVINIFQKAKESKIPIFTYSKIFINLGAVLVITADVPTIGRQASNMANHLTQNIQIKQKVKDPIGSNIILNIKALKLYLIHLNKEALGSVNQLIE